MDKVGEVLIDRSEQTIGTDPVLVGNISDRVCQGKMHFMKRSSGDTIYITVGSKIPSDKAYQIILTDTFPAFSDNVVIGDIRAVGTAAGSKLSTYARGGFYQ